MEDGVKRYRFKLADCVAIVDELDAVDWCSLLSINQHGFIKNRSTITNLLEYASFVLNLEDGNQVDSIY
jgi:hypothetical protein